MPLVAKPEYFILVGFMVLFVAIALSRLFRRRSAGHPSPGNFDAPVRDARSELERLLAEFQELSREQIARLDTKTRVLNQLLVECDKKKKELEDLLARSGGPAPVPARPTPPLHDQVYTLQDSGKDLQEICSATGLEKGEVELILGLRKMPPAGR
jgi:hypothetical protein